MDNSNIKLECLLQVVIGGAVEMAISKASFRPAGSLVWMVGRGVALPWLLAKSGTESTRLCCLVHLVVVLVGGVVLLRCSLGAGCDLCWRRVQVLCC